MIITLALRNFLRQWNRYQVLLTALTLGFAILFVILGTTNGMNVALREKAARYFSGEIVVIEATWQRLILEESAVWKALKAEPGLENLTRRSEYMQNDATLFFAGQSIRQKKLVGVDFQVELNAFGSMDYVSGGSPSPSDASALLISQASATRLGAQVGDDVVVVVGNQFGQKNSISLVVKGIFRDSSFFGYASYLNLGTMNRLMGRSLEGVTSLGGSLRAGYGVAEVSHRLRAALGPTAAFSPVVKTRGDLQKVLDQATNAPRVAVVTLDANLAQITAILNALLIVTWVTVGMFLAIVLIGVSNTYRMVVFERTREIGTLRALGMTRTRLGLLFTSEASFLGLFGALAGSVLGLGLLSLASLVNLGNNSLAQMFLVAGHLRPEVPFEQIAWSLLALIAAAMLGALAPALHGAQMTPANALRME